jgi:DNA-binding response OmpR family regulator
MRILLVEDDVDLAEVVALGLRNESYVVDVARTCAEAEELLRITDVDLACVDLGMPDGDGLDLVRRLAHDPTCAAPGARS